jgi:PAS domain-containing protein
MTPLEPYRLRSLAQTLIDVIEQQPGEPTAEQRTALWDLSDQVQGAIALAADRPAARLELPAARSAARRRVLAWFAAALSVVAVFSTASYRAERKFIEESLSAVRSPEALARDGDRLSALLIVSGVARTAVLLLALLALLRDMSARAEAEDELLRSRDSAMGAAEGRRVAQADAEKLGERLRAVLDHVDVGVIMAEVDGSISVFNVAAERILGAWREQIEKLNRDGTHPAMLEDEKTVVPPGENPLARALKGQIVRNAHLFYRTPFRPKGYHLNVSAVPLRNHQGLLAGAVAMFTERRR